MSYSDPELLIFYAISYAPSFLAFLFVIFLCLTKGKQNPKGTVLLGCAVLITIAQCVLSFLAPYLYGWMGTPSGPSSQWIMYAHSAIVSIMSAISWVLIGLAVFARVPEADLPEFE